MGWSEIESLSAEMKKTGSPRVKETEERVGVLCFHVHPLVSLSTPAFSYYVSLELKSKYKNSYQLSYPKAYNARFP